MTDDWIQLFPVHAPSNRFEYAMAWDGSKIMLFGGNDLAAIYADTWTWDGTDWTERSPATSPGARFWSGVAYDRANGQVVLFGGLTDAGGDPTTATDETWVWDGSDWTQLTPATSPSPRFLALMAYDETRGEVVLEGGADNTGGFTINDTWTWDGTNWTQLTPANQPVGSLGSLAWDPTNEELVRWGGPGATKTWTWDGTDWTAHSPASQPAGPELPGLTNWAAGGKPFTFGGRSGIPPNLANDQTWTWDGTDWTRLFPDHNPGQRADFMLAYDETRNQVLLFGGIVAGGDPFNDTWIYDDSGPFTLHLEA